MSLPLHTEKELLQRTAQGDEAAYRQLFDAYYGYVAKVAWQYMREEALSFDVAQEVFAQVWRKAADIQIDHSLSAYLRRMTVSHSLNLLRTRRRFEWSDELPDQGEAVGKATPHQDLSGRELEDTVLRLVGGLPEKCRAIWLLCREEGKSQKEVAEMLQISLKTVENQMTIALKKLKAGLSEAGFLTFAWVFSKIFNAF
jgi:RNA polymerase sigma-70 factor, ECF subfamily